jgi:branched-chain amino acid transport system permease protein
VDIIFLTILISGLLTGALYALAAEGLNLIWGVMRIVNLAHGELLMLGAVLTYLGWHLLEMNPLLAGAIAFVLIYAFGNVLNRTIVHRVVGAPELISLLLTFGISILITNVTVLAFGAEFRQVRYLQDPIVIAGVPVGQNQLLAGIVSVVLSLGMFWLLQRTRLGRAMRAVAIDGGMAAQVGIDTRRIYNITFGLGAALAGVAGTLVSTLYAFNPLVGQTFILKSFAVVVLGGMGNFLGALIAGLIIGLVESGVAFYLSVHLSEAVAFVVIILTLLLRPSGILGRRT